MQAAVTSSQAPQKAPKSSRTSIIVRDWGNIS